MLLPILSVTIIGAIAGLVLAIASKYMAVPKDQRFEAVRDVLPGANCGACGYVGCDDYAKKLAEDSSIATNLCIPGGGDVSHKISEALGVPFVEVSAKYAIVKCSGTSECTEYVMRYDGPQSCSICNSFYQGRGSCSHACLGFGDCVLVCQYDAIHIVDGVACVDRFKCTACGLCAKSCPNHLIDIVPVGSDVFVGCSSNDKGAYTRKVCRAGCIGCKKCEKICPSGAIVIVDNLACIDPFKCTACKLCIAECPTHVIKTASSYVGCGVEI